MPDLTYRELLDQQRLDTIRHMLQALPRSCADFIRSLLSTTSALTRLAYTIDLGTFFDFALKELPCFTAQSATEVTDAEIALLKPRDVEMYAEYLTQYYRQTGEDEAQQRLLRNQTYGVMRKLSSLRSFFNYLFRTQRIPANIVTLVPLPKKHEKPILLLERQEMQSLLETIAAGSHLTAQQAAFHKITQARDFAIVMLFLGTGIRVSECVGIDVEDIDFRVNALLVTRKGGNQVILYFPREVAEALKAYLAQRASITPMDGHEHALFLSLQRRRISQRAVELMVKKYAMLVVPLKRRMSPHKLRSTYATNLYQATEDIYLVAEALGHSDVNTTRKHYASMSDARMRQAASHTYLPFSGGNPPAALLALSSESNSTDSPTALATDMEIGGTAPDTAPIGDSLREPAQAETAAPPAQQKSRAATVKPDKKDAAISAALAKETMPAQAKQATQPVLQETKPTADELWTDNEPETAMHIEAEANTRAKRTYVPDTPRHATEPDVQSILHDNVASASPADTVASPQTETKPPRPALRHRRQASMSPPDIDEEQSL